MKASFATNPRFECFAADLAGLAVIRRKPIKDGRGSFCRLYCSEELYRAGFKKPISQVNHTFTREKGSVRGFHFQNPPHAEVKMVACLKGEIWDVVVDIRHGSPTFLRWHAENLSGDNGKSLLIPEGFAHGFQTLTEDCELIYMHTASYAPGYEGGIRYDDPKLGIKWPLPVSEVSDRDKGHPLLDDNFKGLTL